MSAIWPRASSAFSRFSVDSKIERSSETLATPESQRALAMKDGASGSDHEEDPATSLKLPRAV
jgi:hypothetical protein